MSDSSGAAVFEWHEAKRLSNIARHGLDFVDADLLFGGPLIVGNAKTVSGEPRKMVTGLIGDAYVTAIYTVRDNSIRMISLRRARDEERGRHQALHARRP